MKIREIYKPIAKPNHYLIELPDGSLCLFDGRIDHKLTASDLIPATDYTHEHTGDPGKMYPMSAGFKLLMLSMYGLEMA